MGWRLYDEDASRYATRLDDECARSRERLERELGTIVDLFAYPYGEAPPSAREAVARAGYRAAFTVAETMSWDGDRLAIPRLDLHEVVREPFASSEPTRFSVVIPACDRVPILREVVRRLTEQSYPEDRFEVLITDDGSREDLRAGLGTLPRNTKVLPPTGAPGSFRAGQTRARGARAARYETIAFLDTDIAVGRDFLWHLDWVHRRVPRAVVLGYLSGYNLHDLGHVHTLESIRDVSDLERDMAIIPDRSREPTLRACLDNLDWLTEPWRLAYTGNVSLPRALFDEIGGFADDFVGWGLEDLDLGYRLHRAGASFVFTRFAIGFHITEPDEKPRNPFRRERPQRGDFDGYLRNLAALRRRHAGDAAIEAFARQAMSDVDETCGAPETVGIELGGACTMACAFHRRINKCQPGGLGLHEALDRLAYAQKIGARQIYILGGEPGEHPALAPLIRAARRAGMGRVMSETNAVPFADERRVREIADAGLHHAIVKVYSFDRTAFERITRRTGSFDSFERGFRALGDAGIARTARVVVPDEALATLPAALDRLAADGVSIDAVVALNAGSLASVQRLLDEHASRGGRTLAAVLPHP
jgi:GT2 family glycosyltransferase